MVKEKIKILILCTGNSCRSQMAQGFLRSFDNRIDVSSAGTFPAPKINPKAVKVMAEVGIDISGNVPRSVEEYLDDKWDYVITVCDEANETCPFFTGSVKHRLHMGFEDPSFVTGKEEFVVNEYRKIRDQIMAAFKDLYTNVIKKDLS